jgi:glycosyltransferase involved in cell wall biosynthesis
MPVSTRQRSIVFLWENFGPVHVDRCEAVQREIGNAVGIELCGRSHTYDWVARDAISFRKVTLFPGISLEQVPFWKRVFSILRACLSVGPAYYFCCHYEQPEILLVATLLRLLGRRVYVMTDSKFDDYKRFFWREMLLKPLFYLPYNGALAASLRTQDYLRFLHFKKSKIASSYNTLSVSRIRSLAGVESAPAGLPFDERHFTVVARFVPKKNLPALLDGYALYAKSVDRPRALHLCGSGVLEGQLRERVAQLNIGDHVVFRGFIQSDEIAWTLGQTLALLLVSVEEQFGLVVIEAQAMGLPVLYTPNCGARDDLLRSSVNGFMVEPDNIAGIAYFLRLMAEDKALWRRLSNNALQSAAIGDVAKFVEGVRYLIEVGEMDARSGTA